MTRHPDIVIDRDVADLFPRATVVAVSLHGVEAERWDRAAVRAAVADAVTTAHIEEYANPLNDDPRIVSWREAYRQFGCNPRRKRPSAEALLRRVLLGRPLSPIHPLVDLYGAVSIRQRLPIGGSDLDRLDGPLTLRLSPGEEPFEPIGGGTEPTTKGEVVWSDDGRVVTRCWNWRDSAATAITRSTEDAVLCVESPDDAVGEEVVVYAAEELAEWSTTMSGCDSTVSVLRPNQVTAVR